MSRLAKLSAVSFARRTILFIGLLLLFVVGLDMLRQLPPPFSIWLPIEWVPLGKLEGEILLIYACLCILLPPVYFFAARVQSRLEKGIVGKGTDGDDICLTPEAVERVVVREVKENVEEVLRVRHCDVLQGRRGARVILNVAVAAQASVPQVRRKVNDSVKNTLLRIIGYSDGTEVKVKVSDVARPGGPSKARRPRKAAPRRKEAAQNE